MLGHLILISAQVQSKSGVPVLEAVTFGFFSRIQGAASSLVGGVRDGWGNYVDLRGVRDENAQLRQQLSDLEVRLQEQRALAARSVRLQELLKLKTARRCRRSRRRSSPAIPIPGRADGHDRSRHGGRRAAGHGGDRAEGRRRPGHRARRRTRGARAAHHRSQRGGRRGDRAYAVGGLVFGRSSGDDPPLGMDLVSNLADVKGGDLIVASGVDGIYPKGFVIGSVESSRARTGPASRDHGAAGGGFFEPRGGAGRAGGRAGRDAGRDGPCLAPGREVRALGVLLAMAVALTLQTTLAGMSVGAGASVNLVLVAVVYVALAFGPVIGLLAGAIGGLAQDALAGGIIGIGGFSKTLVGFMVGVLGAQFIVSQPLSRFIMFVAATFVHELCFQALRRWPHRGRCGFN